MKKFTVLTLFFLFFTTFSFGQERIFYINTSGDLKSVETDGNNNITLSTEGSPFCVATHQGLEKVYFDNGTDILSADFDGSNKVTIINASNPFGIAIDEVNNKIYWSEFNLNQVRRADLDGSNQETIINGVISPAGLALDVANDKLYVITYNSTAVSSSALDGTGFATIIPGLGGQGVAIAVDKTNNKILYSTRGDNIFSADLDGSNPATLITGQGAVQGVTISPTEGKVYWAAAVAGMIRRADLDGSNIEDVAATGGNTWLIAFGGAPLAPAAVPTLGEWGLIILALLLINMGLLFVTVPSLSSTQGFQINARQLPFDTNTFLPICMYAFLGMLAFFTLAIIGFAYVPTLADPVGILLSSPLIAYMFYLLRSQQ